MFLVLKNSYLIHVFFLNCIFRDCPNILYILEKFHSKSMKVSHELTKK